MKKILNRAFYLKKHAYMVDEFIAREIEAGRISKDKFTKEHKTILLHGHCQQKALSGVSASVKMLSLPKIIKCKQFHRAVAAWRAHLVLRKNILMCRCKLENWYYFLLFANADDNTIVAAPGTSCRHQIKDGTGAACTAYC